MSSDEIWWGDVPKGMNFDIFSGDLTVSICSDFTQNSSDGIWRCTSFFQNAVLDLPPNERLIKLVFSILHHYHHHHCRPGAGVSLSVYIPSGFLALHNSISQSTVISNVGKASACFMSFWTGNGWGKYLYKFYCGHYLWHFNEGNLF
jgi:hypothetical protein